MSDYRAILKPMLDKSEGFRDSVYFDAKQNPSIGYGFNLNDPANKELLRLNGISLEGLYNGDKLTPEQADLLRNHSIDRKEKELRSNLSDDVFDNLQPHQQAALQSLNYNSNKLIGPKLKQYLADGDHLNLAKEVLTNSNPKKDLGTLVRRTDEASKYLNDDDSSVKDMFRNLNLEDHAKIQGILNNTDNENIKREYLDKYDKYLNQSNAQPLQFNKLFTNPSN